MAKKRNLEKRTGEEARPKSSEVGPTLLKEGESSKSKKNLKLPTSSNGSSSGSESSEPREEVPFSPNPPAVESNSSPKNKGVATKSTLSKYKTPAPKAIGSKREAQTTGFSEEVSKKAKNPSGTLLDSDALHNSKKHFFERIWSDTDELVVVNGMVECIEKKDIDPKLDISSFYLFIKDKLQFNATIDQLKNKIRRLKDKFRKNNAKEVDGQDLVISNQHENMVYQLSKKIWGNVNKETTVATTKHNLSKEKETLKQDNAVEAFVDFDALHHFSDICYNSGYIDIRAKVLSFGREIFEKGEVVNGSNEWMSIKRNSIELYIQKLESDLAKSKLALNAMDN